jgi:hypothetical protein
MSNPYQAPQTPIGMGESPFSTEPRERLRLIARYQRWVILALVVNIGLNIGYGLAGRSLGPGPALVLGALATLGVIACTMAAVFLLANKVYNTVAAVFCALLMLVPCVSLLVLLVINQKATTILQQHGIKVGFFGASESSV